MCLFIRDFWFVDVKTLLLLKVYMLSGSQFRQLAIRWSFLPLIFSLKAPIKNLMGVKKDWNFLLKFTAGSLAGAIGSTVR